VTPNPARVGGLLLSGGASRRFGSPKAELTVDGERLADRGARLLLEVCDVVIEVGPGYSSLPAVREEPPGSGPLAALAEGADALAARGPSGRFVVLAVDLPFVTRTLLEHLRDHPTPNTVVPRVGGVPQPLCARYSPDAAATARALLDDGARSMKSLLGAVPVTWVDDDEWGLVASVDALADVDTPDDALRSGLQLPG
jgi:molybdopterin-guanine dinucleotide biosynthesis protein A